MARRGSPPARRGRTAVAVLVAAGMAHAVGAAAQQAPGPSGVAGPPATVQAAPLGVSPRGALIRAMLLPGWGHVSIGSHTRGGFYFALETLTAYTFVRTRIRLNEARERAALRESVVRGRLAQEGVTDPELIETRLQGDEFLQSLEDLVSSRRGQQEDLIAWSIFLVFLTGADAYVSAHLARFPAPIDMEAVATPDGRAEVMLRLPFP